MNGHRKDKSCHNERLFLPPHGFPLPPVASACTAVFIRPWRLIVTFAFDFFLITERTKKQPVSEEGIYFGSKQ